MKLHIRVKSDNGDAVMTELTANMEDVFEMLDGIKPRVLADYLAHRMRQEVNPMDKLVNMFDDEKGGCDGTL